MSTIIYSTTLNNYDKLCIFLKMNNTRVKQIMMISDKFYYITDGTPRQFFVYRDNHIKLKDVDNTARLRNFNREVYCIENNVLIFVSNFKRGSITFETPI